MSCFFFGLRRGATESGFASVGEQLREFAERRVGRLERRMSADWVVYFRSGDSAALPHDSRSIFALVDGDPLIPAQDGAGFLDVDAMARTVNSGDVEPLVASRGTFGGCVLDGDSGSVTLFTDRLGVRPVYLAELGDGHAFSSALWVFGAPALGEPQVDLRARAEVAVFGFPLTDRTPDQRIKTLLAGEVVRLDGSVKRTSYWRWSDVRPNGLRGEALVQAVDAVFRDSVQIRCAGPRAVAFLSGGMDSRLIVSALRRVPVEVETLNFAPAGSLDLELGRLASSALGTRHMEFPNGASHFGDRLRDAYTAWRSDARGRGWESRGLWSGDGGSVGLGHVYLSERIVRAAREQGIEAAAKVIQQENNLNLSPGLLRAEARGLIDVPYQGIVDELNALSSVEPGRACHLFFMLNDQRRHLAKHFESSAEREYDLILPFFDARFVELIVGAEIDEFLGHRLYNQLLLSQTTGAGSVPWQAYPSHDPCPLPIPDGLRYQWDNWHGKSAVRCARRALAREGLKYAFGHLGVDGSVISKPRLALVSLLLGIGTGNYEYHVRTAAQFADGLVWP